MTLLNKIVCILFALLATRCTTRKVVTIRIIAIKTDSKSNCESLVEEVSTGVRATIFYCLGSVGETIKYKACVNQGVIKEPCSEYFEW